jgi:hypothetical protein
MLASVALVLGLAAGAADAREREAPKPSRRK